MAFRSKRTASHEGYMLFFEQGLAPLNTAGQTGGGTLVVCPLKRSLNFKKSVERAANGGQTDARYGQQGSQNNISPPFKCPTHLRHTFLGTCQGRERRMLTNTARITRLLALQIAHRLGKRLR